MAVHELQFRWEYDRHECGFVFSVSRKHLWLTALWWTFGIGDGWQTSRWLDLGVATVKTPDHPRSLELFAFPWLGGRWVKGEGWGWL